MSGYIWIKVLHVTAAFVFFAGVVATSLFLSVAGSSAPPPQIIHRIRRWDRRIIQPAMLLTWGLGILAASIGGWFAQGWLFIKIGLVVLLSAIHGLQTSRLRRLADGTVPSVAAWIGPALLVMLVAIVFLVIVKPLSLLQPALPTSSMNN